EAASLAGHLGLGKLVYLYDDNKISIDGATDITFGEDVGARFSAYGWHVQHVDGHDHAAVRAAIEAARSHGERPSLICCRTTIAQGAPTKAGTSSSHGAPLGAAEVAATKEAMGWPADPFHVPAQVRDALGSQAQAHRSNRAEADARMAAYRQAYPELAAELEGLMRGELPANTFEQLGAVLESFPVGGAVASRKAGQKVLSALCKSHPSLLGGSADLAGSNGVVLPDTPGQSKDHPEGRNLHFGVREHGMAGVCNGMALHGGVRPFDATFLVFSDFMRGAMRLAALMGLPVIYVLSHDSFWVGEDGPTHQPIEHTMALRLIPGLHVIRPADARETAGAWRFALGRRVGEGPTAILVTRQDLPVLPMSRGDIERGAYVLWEPEGDAALDGVLIATGSEVATALAAAKLLRERGRRVRVVSMPCWEA
ncbi:MAG: transketolase, partial [Myxococcales bacterium]|nr:transketolase [Myxococcales bacterium]